MVIKGKIKDQATKASALMDSASSSSHPAPKPARTIPPRAPPLIVRPPTVDIWSMGSPLAFANAAESAVRCIVKSAQIKIRSLTKLTCTLSVLMYFHMLIAAPAPKKKRGLCSGKKAEDIYCPRVKGPNVKGINNLVAHDIDCAIRSLVGMRARTFYDLDREEKWKPKYEWDENDESMFNWILKRALERYKDWKYQCDKAYQLEGPSGMPSDFIGREDQWEFLCEHFESDAFNKLSLTNKRSRGEKTMHHHTGSSPIISTIEELRIQGEQLPIIKGFEKTYVKEGDEVTTKYYVSVYPFTNLNVCNF
ncbi:hypothetical protein ACLB2K_063482 [Fragaria x ananassa]